MGRVFIGLDKKTQDNSSILGCVECVIINDSKYIHISRLLLLLLLTTTERACLGRRGTECVECVVR